MTAGRIEVMIEEPEVEYEEEPEVKMCEAVNIQRRPKTAKRSKHVNCRETLIQYEDRHQPLSRGNHWIFDTKPEIYENAYEARLMRGYQDCVK